jgi:hypothetical protein
MFLRILGMLLALYYLYYGIVGFIKIIKAILSDKKVGAGYVLLVFVALGLGGFFAYRNTWILYNHFYHN